MDKIKELIHAKLKEMSSTGTGAGFQPGEGEQYTTKYAFKIKKLKENKDESKSYLNSLNITDPALNKFIVDRITEFDIVEDKLNILLPLLKTAKKETMEYYKTSPEFQVIYGTDLAIDYLDDLITLFRDKK